MATAQLVVPKSIPMKAFDLMLPPSAVRLLPFYGVAHGPQQNSSVAPPAAEPDDQLFTWLRLACAFITSGIRNVLIRHDLSGKSNGR